MSGIFLISLFLELSASALLGQCAYMLSVEQGLNSLYPIIFVIYALVIVFVNKAFLKKERNLGAVALINIIFCAAVLAIEIMLKGDFSFGSILVTAIISIWLTIQSVIMIIKEPELRVIILFLEGNIAASIIFSVLVSVKGINPYWIILSAFGIVFSIVALVLKRMGRKPALRDIIFIIVVSLIVLLIAVLFTLFLADPAGKGLSDLAKIILLGLSAFWNAFEKFASWIASLFKGGNGSGTALEGIGVANGKTASEEYSEADPASGTIVMVIIGVIVAFLIVLLIVKIHKHKIKIRQIKLGNVNAISTKESRSLKEAFKIIKDKRRLKKLKKKFLRENKNSPLGIYYELELKLLKTKDRKVKGESPREFLKRVEMLGRDDIEVNDFKKLADDVDLMLFG